MPSSVDPEAKVFSRWVSCQTSSSSLVLHVGSGWVCVAEMLSFLALPDMSNTTALLPANTALDRSFCDNISSVFSSLLRN